MANSQEFSAEYYLNNYFDYHAQNPEAKLSFYRRMVADHFPVAAPRRIHDIGCAFGLFLGSLDQTWERFGSDASEFAVDRARHSYSGAVFAVSRGIPRNPFGGTFGAVTAFDVLEHIQDLNTCAEAIADQLADQGIFVFAVPVYDGLSGPIVKLLDRDTTHIHRWPRKKWLAWASRTFTVVAWTGVFRYLLCRKFYLHAPTRLFRKHTPAIVVVCRKT